MGQLEKVNLGAEGSGIGGDSPRSANERMNRNVDILACQLPVQSAATITASQTLTADHIGKRVFVNFAVAGGVIKMKRASTCEPDSLVWIVNVGTTTFLLGVDDNSGDNIALGALNPGEAGIFDTDGEHTWRVLLRGRTWLGDESVAGKLTVGSDIKVAGGGVFGARPTFAGKTPWDSGNLNPGNYATVNTFQILTARKRINASQATGAWGDQTFVVESDLAQTGIGFRAATGAMVFRYNNGNASFECVSWDSGAYGPIGASSFNVSSDYRLKKIIGEISDPIGRVRKFRPVMAEYRSSPGKSYPMFIAHTLQEVAPHAVSGDKDAVDVDGLPIYQAVDYSKITPDLAAAIIALADENMALRARVAGIEQKFEVDQ